MPPEYVPPAMSLNDTKARAAKPKEKTYRLADAGGLYLEVTPAGGRYWRWKYRYGGKEKRLAFGVYPAVSLALARARRDEARALLTEGIDPGAAKQEAKREAAQSAANTFEAVAREWHTKRAGKWTPSYADKVMGGFRLHVFPVIGAKPLADVTRQELLAILERVGRRSPYRAKQLAQQCADIFRMALDDERIAASPATDLARSKSLHSHKEKHFAALGAEEFPVFLRALADARKLSDVTRIGLRLLALTFVRPGELRNAQWCEFNLDAATWEIPGERMKMREPHIVPLSGPALASLRGLHAITGNGALLFPSRSSAVKPLSDNTFRKALHSLGFEVTAHGFRSTASTILNEMGFRADVIERQLSHGDRDKVRAAYNRAQYLEERRDMMRQWGEYLSALEQGGKVIPINQRKAAKPN